jgi:argininosuccinate lyase
MTGLNKIIPEIMDSLEVKPTECHDAYSWYERNLIKAVGIPKRLLKGKTQGGSDDRRRKSRKDGV